MDPLELELVTELTRVLGIELDPLQELSTNVYALSYRATVSLGPGF